MSGGIFNKQGNICIHVFGSFEQFLVKSNLLSNKQYIPSEIKFYICLTTKNSTNKQGPVLSWKVPTHF